MILRKCKGMWKKKSPIILSCAGAAGVVITTILAIRATPKAVRLLEDASDKHFDEGNGELTVVEKIKIAGPVYIPTVLAGVATVSCVLGSNFLTLKQQLSLASAYAIVDSSYRNYRDRLISLHGKETDIEVLDNISMDRYYEILPSAPADGKVLWYEPYSDIFFERTEKEIIDAEYHVNRNFTLRGESNLNEFYEFLGLESTDYGCDIGWNACDKRYGCENMWIDFEHHLVQDRNGDHFYRIEIVYPSKIGIPEG